VLDESSMASGNHVSVLKVACGIRTGLWNLQAGSSHFLMQILYKPKRTWSLQKACSFSSELRSLRLVCSRVSGDTVANLS